MRRLWPIAVLLLVTACSSATEERGCFSAPEVAGPDHVTVSWGNICVPLGRFIIVKHGSFVAAIRFTSLHTSDDDHNSCARFELYEQNGRHRRSSGTVSRLSSSGIHPFVIMHGDWRIRTGDLTLVYDGLACLELPRNAQVAPTSWTKIEDVDATDPALQWFSLDATMTREAIMLPR